MRVVLLLSVAVWAVPGVAVAAAPEVRATPAQVLLGQDTAVELEVRVRESAGPVRAAASSGSFAQPVVEGGTLRKFHWTPPEVRYPLPAVLAFWVDMPSGPPEVAVIRIPLLGRTTLPVSTDPGAEVVIELGNAHFGPVKASRRGKALVPIEVPPGVKEAHVLATRGSLKTDRLIRLDVPDHRPLVALISPQPLPGSGGWLIVAAEKPLSASEVEISAEGARLEPQAGAPLRYRVSPLKGAVSVSVQARRRQRPDSTRVEAAIQRGEEVARPTVASAPSAPAVPSRWAVHLLAGGFFAGGANRGPAVALGVSYPLPLWNERVAAELEVGLRRATLDAMIDGYGTLHSSVLAGPMLAAARVTLVERAAFALYGRAGAGVLPFQHDVSSDFQPSFGETQLGPMAFLAAQGALRLGSLSILMEFRGEYGPARTDRLDAQLGGAGASLGVRYEP